MLKGQKTRKKQENVAKNLTYNKAIKKVIHFVGDSVRKKITTKIGYVWDPGRVYE